MDPALFAVQAQAVIIAFFTLKISIDFPGMT